MLRKPVTEGDWNHYKSNKEFGKNYGAFPSLKQDTNSYPPEILDF